MTTPVTPTRIDYDNVIEAVPYNFNVPVSSEVEIEVELLDENGVDITNTINYTVSLAKSIGSPLFDINTITLAEDQIAIPIVNTLNIRRITSELQQTLFEFRADLSVETANEVDRLTRFQQDTNDTLEIVTSQIDEIKENINPVIGTDRIADNAVTNDQIADNSISANKLSSNSVETPAIVDSAVTASKIAANAVTATKIANEAVTTPKIAPAAITTPKIASNAITTSKIANESITSDKLSQEVLDRFDQNIPLKFSVSQVNARRLRIEASEIVLNDSTSLALGTGKAILAFEGVEIDFVTGDTYDLNNVKTGVNIFNFPVPSQNQFRTYIVQAMFSEVSSQGKVSLVLDIQGGQQALVLGNQEFPKRGLNQEVVLGYVTVQEEAGTIAELENSNLISLDSVTNEAIGNISRIKVDSHKFNVGSSFIPVFWNGKVWCAAKGDDVRTLATHLIIDVVSDTEFTIALSGRIFYPNHGFQKGVYYFTSDTEGVLSIIEAENFSNPMLQGEDEDHFNLLGWRANEKALTDNILGVDRRIIETLPFSTPYRITSSLTDIYSISVYDSSRCKLPHEDVEIRIEDDKPNEVVLFSPVTRTDIRVDIIGVR